MIKYKKYQTAGTLYVDDPKHPRLQAYQDSLTLHDIMNEKRKVIENVDNSDKKGYIRAEDLLDNRRQDDGLKLRPAYDRLTKLNGKPPKGKTWIRDFGLETNPGIVHKVMEYFNFYKPTNLYMTSSLEIPDKPIQPVIYKSNNKYTSVNNTKSKTISKPLNPNIVAKQKLIGTTPDGIWGPKSEEAWKQYQNKNTTTPIQSTPAPVVNNPQIVNTPVQVVEPKSPSFKYTKYNGQTYDMSPSMEKEVDKAMYNRQSGGNLKYQVAGRTQLNKDFIEGVSSSKPKKTINKPDLYNNPTEIDNTKVNYQQAPIIYKTYPQNVNGKTVNVPTNQGTISQGNPDTFKDTLYNRSKNSKTFNNLANNLIVPITNIAGGLEGANLIKQGVKNIIKRIPKKVPLKVNDISNEIRLYNRNFNNNPTDNYKAIIDKGTNPIISKDIPDEPYERIFHRKYTHGNPDDMHKIIRVNNENINGFANSLSHINNEEDMEPLLKNIIKKYNKENHPNEKGGLNYKPDWLQSIMEKGKQRKPFAKRPNLNTQKSEMSFNFENMINNNHLSKIYKDLERRNIDISNINRIKNNLYKFDDIE